ncbi:Organic solvent tolerance protein [uncultured Desulfobacterium sp.]|uniref:Organic solvent tolerance protein n=1 Tax=uncultured Desulfobacterium sp. TaxID=201089 RepID=A0A445N207_9BACT|nr:Organic solvent tolerance protein [uncultured Desulfobacterium sp.]
MHKKSFISVTTIILTFLALSPCFLFAGDLVPKIPFSTDENAPWKITARVMSYKDKETTYEAQGDVVISRGEFVLRAQKAVYNTTTGLANLSGDVRLEKTGGDVLTGQSAVFDSNTKTGMITDGCLFMKENNFYVRGGHIEKLNDDTYLVKDCEVTTCDGPDPAWSITCNQVRVTIEGYGSAKHAALRLRNIPFIYVPYIIFPAKVKRQSGLLPPNIGNSSRNGLDLEIPFFWAISDQTDATFYQRYLSRRGYMQGLEFRFIGDDKSKGALLMDILSDREEKELDDPDDVEISPFPRTNDNRYWFRGRADQDMPLGIVARMDADYVSDQDYLNEFDTSGPGFRTRPDLVDEYGRPFAEKRSPIRRSAVRLSRDAEDYSLQAITDYNQLPGSPLRHYTAQPLGGICFNLLPENISGLPLFFNLDSDYDYVWRKDGQKGHRVLLSPGLTAPLKLGRYVEFEPSFRYYLNPQRYSEAQSDYDDQRLRSYEAEVKLSTNLVRTYDIDIMGAKRFQHKIRPTVSYGNRGYNAGEHARPWFEPIEEEGDENLVTFSLENFFDARMEDQKGNVSYSQWAKLTLSQGYNVEEERNEHEPEREEEPFEPLFAQLTLSPHRMYNFFAESKWDHQKQEITYTDLSLELSVERAGARKDRFGVDYIYDKNPLSVAYLYEDSALAAFLPDKDITESIDLWFDVYISHGLSVGSSFEKDLDIKKGISNRYWLQYQRQCWGLKLVARDEDDDTSVVLMLQLLGLGDTDVL